MSSKTLGNGHSVAARDGARSAALQEAVGHSGQPILLGNVRRGYRGVVHAIEAARASSALDPVELESRLIELGFVEGARIEVLHEGIIGRDPIAVRVDNITIAVRRREAMAVVLA